MPVSKTRTCGICGKPVAAEGLDREHADDRSLDVLWNHYMNEHRK
jgi:hypothetical protein